MSAIFGLFNTDGRPASIEEANRMYAALATHGQGGGIWAEGRVGLGQRLMCFTPEDRLERQPASGGEGNYTLVTDGRVDNRPELMRELGIPAAEAREMPDSAFILRAYEKWGIECCGRLIGDFAFALYDRPEDRLIVAKSGMSRRQIYYREVPGRFAFSSVPKGLFALPWVPRALDHQSLADYLVRAPRDPGRSLYAGVNELQDGRVLTIRRAGSDLREHWKPDPRREIRYARDSDYVDAFNELFERVAGDHLRSITPAGVMLSGGLDSSAVAVTAARLLAAQRRRLTAFTEIPSAGFDGPLPENRYADETPLVEAIGRCCDNLDLNFVRTDGALLLDGIQPFFEAAEGPFPAAWNRIWFEEILRQSGHRNIRVLLTGAPGNMTISREGEGFFPEMITQGRWLRAYREARACAREAGGGSSLSVLARGAAPLLPRPLWLLAGRIFRPGKPKFRAGEPWRKYSAIRREFARLHRVEERARANGHDFRHYPGPTDRAERYAAVRFWGSSHLLSPGYETLFGVQFRNPTGDSRLVEFCIALPEDQHFRNGMPRSLIRRAMADRLPREVLVNRRRGLQAADWIERAKAGRSQMLDELTCLESSELARSSLDLRGLRSLLERVCRPDFAPYTPHLNYNTLLGSAFMTGSFIRWFESFGQRWGRDSGTPREEISQFQ